MSNNVVTVLLVSTVKNKTNKNNATNIFISTSTMLNCNNYNSGTNNVSC